MKGNPYSVRENPSSARYTNIIVDERNPRSAPYTNITVDERNPKSAIY